MSPKRKLFVVNVIFAALLLLSSCSNKVTNEERPNILFIMSDDHTSQAWGVYGGVLKDYVKTPNISRLVDEGCLLSNCFCSNSICTPSRATILTGQYSHRNGVYTLTAALEPDSMNVAKLLKNNGYQTAIVGKWHLKKQPAGFDYFNVLPDQGKYWNPRLKNKDNWKDHYEGGTEYQGFSTDIIADQTINWIENRDEKKPFMMMCHFKATHEPFDYPERYKELYAGIELPEPESLYDFGPQTTNRSFVGQKLDNLASRWMQASKDPDKWWCKYPGLPFSTEGLDRIQARKKTYQKFVKDFIRCGAAIDDNIGKLLNYLESSGQLENTIVIYTADQGYFLGEHGFFDKRMIYEESLRMPFVIRYSKEVAAGSKCDDIIQNVDFPSLLLDYAGIETPSHMQGRSFRANLAGETPKDWRKSSYYRYWLHSVDRPGHFGIRNDRYKLAFFYGHHLNMKGAQRENTIPVWEFYDLEKDPNENHNAYDDIQYTQIIKEMKAELKKQRAKVGDTDDNFPVMRSIIDEYWN